MKVKEIIHLNWVEQSKYNMLLISLLDMDTI